MPRARLEHFDEPEGKEPDVFNKQLLAIKQRLLGLGMQAVANLEELMQVAKTDMLPGEQRAATVQYQAARVIFDSLGCRNVMAELKPPAPKVATGAKVAKDLAAQFPKETLEAALREQAKAVPDKKAAKEADAARAVPLFDEPADDEHEDEGDAA